MTTDPFAITAKAVKVLESSQTLEQHATAKRYAQLARRALRKALDNTANRKNNYNHGLWQRLAGEIREASLNTQAYIIFTDWSNKQKEEVI